MTKILGIFVTAALILPTLLFAQNSQPQAAWQKVRDQQPKALHLKMTLAKDHFYQGEKIDATVEFSNDDAQNPFSVEVGCGAPGAIFSGWDNQGQEIINPFQWRDDWLGICVTGPVGSYPVGHYTLQRPINENIRFDQPGVYTVYALASVFHGTDPFKNPNASRTDLVSDPVTITITPLSPEQEAQAITAATQKIGTPVENYYFGVDAGIEELNFLQTPAARTELISHLGNPKLASAAGLGLESAPNPPAEAVPILAAVQAGKLTLDDVGISIYGELKASRLFVGKRRKDFTEKQAEDLDSQRIPILNQARKEITDALVQASGQKGPAHVEALWTAFEQQAIYRNPEDPDKDGGAARRALAEHQLELSPDHIKRLIDAWPYWGSADFLPLIRREVKAGTNDPAALVILAGLSPEEAKPLVITELSQFNSKLLGTAYPSSMLYPGIAPMPLPQFDDLFRSKLPGGTPLPLIPVIGCFGSEKLLPNVIDFFHQDGSRWDDAIKQNFYLYWMRCNSKEGCAGFEQEIKARGKQGDGFLVSTLRNSWRDEARPAVNWALEQDDPIRASEAMFLLQRRGVDSDLNPMITALERLKAQNVYPSSIHENAHEILANNRWHPTAVQKKRLEVLAQ